MAPCCQSYTVGAAPLMFDHTLKSTSCQRERWTQAVSATPALSQLSHQQAGCMAEATTVAAERRERRTASVFRGFVESRCKRGKLHNRLPNITFFVLPNASTSFASSRVAATVWNEHLAAGGVHSLTARIAAKAAGKRPPPSNGPCSH